MGGYARLDRVYVTSAMPKTRTGKTMRRLLRDVVVHGAPTGDTSAMEDPARAGYGGRRGEGRMSAAELVPAEA